MVKRRGDTVEGEQRKDEGQKMEGRFESEKGERFLCGAKPI